MGLYINPPTQTKEDWLAGNGTVLGTVPVSIEKFDHVATFLPVCLIDNGAFTAAGIAFDQREFDAMRRMDDHRRKLWFLVPVTKLCEVMRMTQDQLLAGG